MSPERVHVRVDGRDHLVLVRRPDVPASGSVPRPGGSPLLLVLHGSGGNAELALQMSGILDLAPATGYMVAAPQAAVPLDTGDRHPAGGWAWSVPGVPHVDGTSSPHGDDVDTLLRIADSLSLRFEADTDTTYLAGFSGGARMACAVALAAPERVAGLAAVAGLRAGRAAGPPFHSPSATDPPPARPVPVIAFHGTADPVNAFDGDGEPRWGYSVECAARAWATRNGVPAVPDSSRTAPQVVRHRYGAGRPGEVQLHVIEGGGHTWPGGTSTNPLLGTTTDEISATGLMLEFFARNTPPRTAPPRSATGSRAPDDRPRP